MTKVALSVVVLLALVALAGNWYIGQDLPADTPVDSVSRIDSEVSSPDSIIENASPFVVISPGSEPTNSQPDIAERSPVVDPELPVTTASLSRSELPAWDSALSESQLSELVAALNADPALLQQLIDEFRQETDPARKKKLAMVLGETGGEQATLVASELIFSGDSEARTLGMDLLQDIQPGNAQARDIASNMLATEIEPAVLIDAMTALSRPGDVDSDSRAYLSDQLAWLTTHEDDGVRSISLDILSRWSEDGRYTDTLVAGLNDESEYVRKAAAYSLVGHENSSAAVVDSLFTIVRKASERRNVKRAAILALKSMPLSALQRSELDALELKLNTVPR
ncbi:MAG: HEAT repeat domain-containing protein [Granulosicoccus sp.]